MICIFGSRRTGTNYTEVLVSTNLVGSYVANLNGKNPDNVIYGSKHSLWDRPLDVKFAPENTNIGVIRNPISWIWSRRWYNSFVLKIPLEKTVDTFNPVPVVKKEWNRFYSELLDILPRSRVFKYEDLAISPKRFVKKMSAITGLEMDTFRPVTLRIMPARVKGGRFSCDSIRNMHWDKVWDHDVEVVRELIDRSLLKEFGYRIK